TVGDARAAWSHLRFLGLPERLMGPEEHARFDAPQVFFLGHDRRRAIALDFETHGWADSAR
ncbi:MAG: hypothetical protein KDK70_20920, partial [Myxococcales bacterium]|nr:hypothetical protein [Myxococcales bacterium]